MTDYQCWTVTCKTKGCGCLLFLDVIGPAQKFRHTLLPPLSTFVATCPECKEAHSYGASNVDEKILKDPPKDYRCLEFLKAIQNGGMIPSSTAGFNDGDGSDVAGVFWHSGGHILNREGELRYLEPESPGWYYWFEDLDKFRHLRGPFDSQEDAAEDLESSVI
jgi:hypothetical protein